MIDTMTEREVYSPTNVPDDATRNARNGIVSERKLGNLRFAAQTPTPPSAVPTTRPLMPPLRTALFRSSQEYVYEVTGEFEEGILIMRRLLFLGHNLHLCGIVRSEI